MLVKNAVNLFLEDRKCYCSERTILYYRENLVKFTNLIDVDSLDQVTKNVYKSYIAQLRCSGVKNTTVCTYTRAVRTFLNWCWDNEYIDTRVTERVKLPRSDAEIVKPLSTKEIELIRSNIYRYDNDLYFHLIFNLLLECGLRRQEVINLNVKDINFEEKILYINDSKYNKSRAIPLPDTLAAQIHYYLSINHFQERLFPTLTISGFKHYFNKMKLYMGNNRLHAHLLRHTFATSFMYYGGELETLRILLGHSSYDVTQNYLHLSEMFKISKLDVYKIDDCFFNY